MNKYSKESMKKCLKSLLQKRKSSSTSLNRSNLAPFPWTSWTRNECSIRGGWPKTTIYGKVKRTWRESGTGGWCRCSPRVPSPSTRTAKEGSAQRRRSTRTGTSRKAWPSPTATYTGRPPASATAPRSTRASMPITKHRASLSSGFRMAPGSRDAKLMASMRARSQYMKGVESESGTICG